MRRRALLYAALALAIPLPALAVSGSGGPADAPVVEELSVAASLDTCGTAAATIVCKIDASWNQIAGADRYTASVTRADGSVVDFGEVGAGSASFWVPYVGNGAYTVSVSAYGTPPGAETPEVVAHGSSVTGSETGRASGGAPEDGGPEAVGGPAADEPGSEPVEEPEEPDCEEPQPVEEPEPEPGPATGAEKAGADELAPAALSDEASAALDASAELPESIDCDPEAGPETG